MAEKVIGIIPGQPMVAYAKTTGPADAGAETSKATTCQPVTPQGALVNPVNKNGRSGDRGLWQGQTDWATTSNTHA